MLHMKQCNSPDIKKKISWCNNQAPGGIFYSQAGNSSKPFEHSVDVSQILFNINI